MGRKIPGKKHHGVKDPLKQQAKRLEDLKPKINAPPKNVDEQAVPKSLERVISLKSKFKSGIIKKKKKKKSNRGLIVLGPQNTKLPHPKAKPEKIVPIFNQKLGETPVAFMRRVGRETEAFLHETKFEHKFNVQVKRNEQTGDYEGLEKRPKDELEELLKLKSKHKNIKKKKAKKPEGEVKLSKEQKKKKKMEMKKDKKFQDQIDEFQTFKDHIEFGEVAHAPPELKVRPSKADKESSVRPGRKDLLLNSLLNQNKQSDKEFPKKIINRAGKRKDLPVGERMRLEKQQSDVVAAYRLLKSQKKG